MFPTVKMMSVLSQVVVLVTSSSFLGLLEFHKSPALLCTSVWANRNKTEWTTASVAFEFPNSIVLWCDMKAGQTMTLPPHKGTIFPVPRNLCLESSWVEWCPLKMTRIALTLTFENVLLHGIWSSISQAGWVLQWGERSKCTFRTNDKTYVWHHHTGL